MDVHLLVYDLSHGLASQMSMSMLGFQLDAVYHTSILIEGLEYVYQQSIRVVQPGAFSGFGTPIEKILLGQTHLPHEVIIDYLQSIKDRFTPQAYNLFKHNCNTFTNEFSNFLVGKPIPAHITNMPQAVLNTPFGAMLQARMDGVFPSGDPLPDSATAIPSLVPSSQPQIAHSSHGTVKTPSSMSSLKQQLDLAKDSFAVIFFTSATCPPCKMLYPLYDELAKEVGDKGQLIKVDMSRARDVGMHYSISATPTFMTFLKGEQQERWSGADGGRLKSAIHLLVQMAHPQHRHNNLKLPSFFAQSTEPVLYRKIPPLDKLTEKLGPLGRDAAVTNAKRLIEATGNPGSKLDLEKVLVPFTHFVQRALRELPLDSVFAAVDLLRCLLLEPARADFLLSNEISTIQAVLDFVNSNSNCPYPLRLVTIHMACNLAVSSLYADRVLGNDEQRKSIVQLITSNLLDETHNSVRVSASTLLLNIALVNNKPRRHGNADIVPESDQVELSASTLEAIARETDSEETLKGLVLALGFLLYLAPQGNELVDLLGVLDAKSTLQAKKKDFPKERLIDEVSQLLEALTKPQGQQ